MTRFYDELNRELEARSLLTERQQKVLERFSTGDRTQDATNAFLAILNDERCKRILFDSRQAATFDALEDGPPENWQSKLHPPFQWFFLELTEPILVGEQEPGREDPLRAILFRNDTVTAKLIGSDSTLHLANVIFFFRNYEDNTLTDRGFSFHLPTGFAATRISGVLVTKSDPSQVPEDVSPQQYFFAGTSLGIEHRYIGWYERAIMDYSSLLSWTFVYMMAKGISVVEEQVSRQQRRLYARKKVPTPWHIVRVEPRIQTGVVREEPQYHHSFRYDVMGHLRFGKHKLGSGEYRETIEWVRDHQRGLANELYIPKTSKFEGGKVEHPAMRRYFARGKKE